MHKELEMQSHALINRNGRLKTCGTIPALTIFVANAPTSSFGEDEVQGIYMGLEKFCREDHTFSNVIIGDFNGKDGPRKTSEEHWHPQIRMGRAGLAAVWVYHDDQNQSW
ncbi:unnamed protein product [Angiostrongylus costaricensis]|uniref:Endo/exonuclease/phosphatase domain-containing protein n=1 Tax=Angiostrongylus costaricensis TaxID=334426 RepID=A0A0R3PZQ8_ANGCS|nr:unnamed protein product [Angiostrongylus costaricensis]